MWTFFQSMADICQMPSVADTCHTPTSAPGLTGAALPGPAAHEVLRWSI
jgi:hypothetical protein